MRGVYGSIVSLAPYHLLAYGSVLGMQLYQTFVVTSLSYRALPLPHFRTLQKSVFPAYFSLQLLLITAVAATHPPYSLISLVKQWDEAVPISIMFVAAVLNWGVWGPRSLRAMIAVAHQETRDRARYGDEVKSEEMKAVRRQFSKAHAMSIHVNLVNIVGTVWYGVVLASNLSDRSILSSRE